MEGIWTIQDVEQHIYLNRTDLYGMAILVSALYKKLYGQVPGIGLSGAQAEAAEVLVQVLPDKAV